MSFSKQPFLAGNSLLVSIVVYLLFLETVTCGGGNLSKLKTKTKRESANQFHNPNLGNSQTNWRMYSTAGRGNQRLGLPSKTKISITPSITIPITEESTGLDSSFQASIPMSFKLDDLKWGLLGHELFDFGWSPPSKKHFRSEYLESKVGDDSFDLQMPHQSHARKARDLKALLDNFNTTNFKSVKPLKLISVNSKISTKRSESCKIRNLNDRKGILKKFEMFAGSFGIDNPNACLLRAACEIHETPVFSGLGLLGEVVTSIFSIADLSQNCMDAYNSSFLETLSPFIEAEIAGKSGKCQKYRKQCTKSIFTEDLPM